MTRARVGFRILVCVVVAYMPLVTGAQFPEPVQSGVRVRVWVPEAWLQDGEPWRRQRLRGTVASVTADTLHLAVFWDGRCARRCADFHPGGSTSAAGDRRGWRVRSSARSRGRSSGRSAWRCGTIRGGRSGRATPATGARRGRVRSGGRRLGLPWGCVADGAVAVGAVGAMIRDGRCSPASRPVGRGWRRRPARLRARALSGRYHQLSRRAIDLLNGKVASSSPLTPGRNRVKDVKQAGFK